MRNGKRILQINKSNLFAGQCESDLLALLKNPANNLKLSCDAMTNGFNSKN